MKAKATKRDRGTGRYTWTLTAACTCGHPLSAHTAERVQDEQPCLIPDCSCESFKKTRPRRPVERS